MDEKALAEQIVQCGRASYDIAAVLLNSWPSEDHPIQCEAFVLTKQRHFTRTRKRVSDVVVDLFVADADRFRHEMTSGERSYLAYSIGHAKRVFGEIEVSEDLKKGAIHLLEKPAPPPSRGQLYRFQRQPYDLLRKFRAANFSDLSAAVVLNELLKCIIDGYFALNRIQRPEIERTLEVISSGDAHTGALLTKALKANASVLQSDCGVLESLVSAVFGRETAENLTVEAIPPLQPPFARQAERTGSVTTNSRNEHRAFHSYGIQIGYSRGNRA